MLHDARDPERMIENLDGVAHFDVLRLGKKVVHQAIVRTLERAAVKEVKGNQRLERLEIDSVDDFQVLGGGELPDHRRDYLDVRQLRKSRRRS